MTVPGPEQTLFVVASTDMERSAIMLQRIREQLGKFEELGANGEFELSVAPITLVGVAIAVSLGQQVQQVADLVTNMAEEALDLARNPGPQSQSHQGGAK